MAYEASSVASALASWSAVMLASRPASCADDEGLGGKAQQGICYLCIYGVFSPSTVESRAASALASLAEES